MTRTQGVLVTLIVWIALDLLTLPSVPWTTWAVAYTLSGTLTMDFAISYLERERDAGKLGTTEGAMYAAMFFFLWPLMLVYLLVLLVAHR